MRLLRGHLVFNINQLFWRYDDGRKLTILRDSIPCWLIVVVLLNLLSRRCLWVPVSDSSFDVYCNSLPVCLPEFPLLPSDGRSRDLTYMPTLCLGYSLTLAHVQE